MPGEDKSVLSSIFGSPNSTATISAGILGVAEIAKANFENKLKEGQLAIQQGQLDLAQEKFAEAQEQEDILNQIKLLEMKMVGEGQALDRAGRVRGEPELVSRAFESAQNTELAGARGVQDATRSQIQAIISLLGGIG